MKAPRRAAARAPSATAARTDPGGGRGRLCQCWYKVYLICSSRDLPLFRRERARLTKDLELHVLAGRPGAAQARGGGVGEGLGTGSVKASAE
ncbi:hypothetical protein MRA01_51030 [Methylobacterium radiotolerans]|nr:hypothetical protein MRA01_51030 [Methylobacterium radiotolerans]